MILIDSHCHLDMIKTDNLDLIIQKAKEYDVLYMQTICTQISNIDNIIKLSEKYENVFASCGTHPDHTINEEFVKVENLIQISKHPKIIGFGETGLDYHYENHNKSRQKLSFLEHIYASQTAKLPLITHSREAESDTIDLIKTHIKEKPFTGLLHCFTGSKEFAKQVLDLGFYISFSGIITFKNAYSLRDVVDYVPLSRLLIETDSPFLTPNPIRGEQNEPAFVKFVAEEVAKIKQTNINNIAKITTDNFASLFTKTRL